MLLWLTDPGDGTSGGDPFRYVLEELSVTAS